MWQRYRKAIGMGVAGLLAVSVLAGGGMAAGTALAGGAPAGGPGGTHAKYATVFVEKLAAILGITSDTLTTNMKQAAQQTVDQAVTNGELTQDQATKLKSRMDSGGFPMGGFGGMRGKGGPGMKDGAHAFIDRDAVITAVAQRLGITVDQLKTELKSGKTVEQLATDHGVTVDDLKATVVATVKPLLDKAVTDGKMTQEQANAILAKIQAADGKMLLGEAGEGKEHRGGPGGPGRRGPGAPTNQGSQG